ncbi:MAG: biotin/lipoyl-containing protein, partial [Pseudomonadota bacterium]
MPINITMPALSPTMEEGTLARWMVKEGDTVSSGDVIAEIETDKATMEVEAVDEGVVGKITVAEGTEGVKVNAVIAVLLEDGEDATAAEAAPAAPSPQETTAPAPEPGPPSDSAATHASAPAAPQASSGDRIFASPLARRIAADKGLDLSQIRGSGPKGRIVKADVESAEAQSAAPAATAPAPEPGPRAAPVMAESPGADQVKKLYVDRTFEEVPLDGMRKTIAA